MALAAINKHFYSIYGAMALVIAIWLCYATRNFSLSRH